MLKILILGSSGVLGNQLYKELKKIHNIQLFHSGLRKRKVEFLSKIKLRKFILSINPNLIINCIAYTNIDKCQSNKLLSRKINFEIIKEIFKFKIKEKLNFNFIHFSTDQFYNQTKKNLARKILKFI